MRWRWLRAETLGLLLLTLAAMALLLSLPAWWDPWTIRAELAGAAPFAATSHWLGTDDLGRDLMSRLLTAAGLSLAIGLLTGLVSLVAGGLYGLVAARNEGWAQTLLMGVLDVLYSLPALVVVVLFGVFAEAAMAGLGWGGSSLWRLGALVLGIAFIYWLDTARLVRGRVLSLKREEFMEAYMALGGGFWRWILRQCLPNVAGVLLASLMLTVPRAVLTETTLSFIGLGVEPPLSSLGTMIRTGWTLVRSWPHLLIVPSLALIGLMVLLNSLAERWKRRLAG